jgi:Cu/Zn superoxide dismutase
MDSKKDQYDQQQHQQQQQQQQHATELPLLSTSNDDVRRTSPLEAILK